MSIIQMMKGTSVNDETPEGKRRRDVFAGQVHFPVISPPLSFPTIVVLLFLAVASSLVVWWLVSD